MSFPEIARFALLNHQGIVFEQHEEEEKEIKINSIFDTEGYLF